MIRRSIRTGFRIGLLAGIAFALFKLVQSRRPSSPLSSGSEWAAPPTRTGRSGETPLVDPHMLQGVSLKKPAAEPQSPERPSPGSSSPAATPASPMTPPAEVARKKAAPPAGRARKAAKVARKAATWVDPKGGVCPASHPIKAKLSSGIYHLRGMAAYERTNPDRCYRDEDTAQADGLRKAKR